jgi:hypothetical protein
LREASRNGILSAETRLDVRSTLAFILDDVVDSDDGFDDIASLQVEPLSLFQDKILMHVMQHPREKPMHIHFPKNAEG